jgi:hypothetical protein
MMAKLKRMLLVLAVTLVGTVGVASAYGHSCEDKKGDPHYCWEPDRDPTFTLTVQKLTVNVPVNQVATAEADCTDEGAYAVSGGYQVMPKNQKIGYVVMAKVLNDGPAFSGNDQESSPKGWTVTVVNRGAQTAIVTVYATCMQAN